MSMRKYNAFIFFRGEGVDKGFVDQLYNDFKRNGIRAYRDHSDFNGITGHILLDEPYEKSMCSIAFFYEKYDSDLPYSLSEIVYIFESRLFHEVMSVYFKYEPGNEAAYGAKRHEWRKALSMAATFEGHNLFDTRNGYQSYIDAIIEGLSKIIYEKSSGCKGFELISPLERRLSIFWDIENSPIPTDVIPEDIVKNIVAFVQHETGINWEVDDVYAYGNIYFANTLHALRRLGHNIILAISSEVSVSTPLIDASNYNWYWSNVAKGPTSSSQVQIEELPDDNYNWYRSSLVKVEDLVPTSRSQIKELSMRRKLIHLLAIRLFIFWDLENCSIPGEVHAKDVVINILAFISLSRIIDRGGVRIHAYADLSLIDRKVRAYLEESGVKLIDTPHVKKDAADEAMIVDMLTYSNLVRSPSSIMVITGDVDFATTLHVLRQFGHDIFLAIPSGVVSKSLTNASKDYWYWSDVANGIEELSHVDLTSLKGQLVKLLESNGGELRLGSLATEYHKIFKKRPCPSEYKANKLVNLLKKMSDVISVEKLNGETLVKLKG